MAPFKNVQWEGQNSVHQVKNNGHIDLPLYASSFDLLYNHGITDHMGISIRWAHSRVIKLIIVITVFSFSNAMDRAYNTQALMELHQSIPIPKFPIF